MKRFAMGAIAMLLASSMAFANGQQEGKQDSGSDQKKEEEKVVNIFGAFVDEDARRFDACFADFEAKSGIDVVYEGSGDFESLITVRVEGGDPPDMAAFPQPGLLDGFAKRKQVVDLNDWFDTSYMQGQYEQHWLDMATMHGIMAGIWHRANVKSLVWYNKPIFQKQGYAIPQTWDELLALSDKMVSDGFTPWAIGMESSGATGWVATDWMEDVLLRTTSPENYDKWVKGELPFNSPEVKEAAEYVSQIWFNEDYVYGGKTNILTVPFGDSPKHIIGDDPKALMHRQASFIPAFFPDKGAEIQRGEVDFFYFPPIKEKYGKPVLGAGDIYGVFVDNPNVREVAKFMTTGESTKKWVQAGGFVSPHKDSKLDWYPTKADKKYAEIIKNADTFRFDGSDLMPGEIGTGAFWTGMVDWVSGQDLEKVMKRIDGAWPR